MFLNGNVQLLFKCCTSLLKYSYQGGDINNICLLTCILVGFSLSSVLQTCFQNPLANLTLTPFDNSPEAPSDSMTGVSYSPFFVPQVVSSPATLHSNSTYTKLSYLSSRVRSLTVCDLRAAIKDLVTLLCLDPTLYSTHSLRRGGATFAFSSGRDTL